MEITVDNNLGHFVLANNHGVTCFGFDVCHSNLTQLLQNMDKGAPTTEPGTLQDYDAYRAAIAEYADHPASKNTWFEPGTDARVKDILEAYRSAGKKLRIFCGNTETGVEWFEEHDVYGKIGRSTGVLKSPLLVPNNADGGMAIFTAHILKIVDGESKLTIYKHLNYKAPVFKLVPAVSKGYVDGVEINGVLHAQFKKPGKADRWIDFMAGRRMVA